MKVEKNSNSTSLNNYDILKSEIWQPPVQLDWPAEKLREPDSPYSGFAVEQNELGEFIEKGCADLTPDYTNEWKQHKDETIPAVLYRGERVDLSNIDQVGKKSLTTRGNERHGNGHGARLSLARDLDFAKIYAVGLDGRPDYYDHVLSKTEIPIGITFRIKNTGNVINAVSDNDPLIAPGYEMDGLCREFIVENGGEITPDQYDVVGLYIMDDYVNPHQRSDHRQPLEYFPVPNPDDLRAVIDRVKARTDELDQRRNQ